ncbi:zinc finger protein 354A-like isoform X1 [Sergentomyia squamirostris]
MNKIITESFDNLQCRECGDVFQDCSSLEDHRKFQHNSFTCNFCSSEKFSLTNFEYHLQKHGGFKFFTCILCQAVFSILEDLNNHLPMHLDNSSVDLINSPDDDTTSVSHEMVEVKINDENVETKKKRGRPKKIVTKGQETEKKYKCSQCPYTSKNASNLKKHLKTHTGFKPYECALCGKVYAEKYDLRIHLQLKHTKPEKKETCSFCGKTFNFMVRLQSHIRAIHRPREKISCFICGKLYSTRGGLYFHLKTHNKDPETYKCDECNKSFEKQHYLQRHNRQVHTAARFFCKWEGCIFRTVSRSVLVDHQRTHTGEKPFLCATCNRAFATKASLTSHISQRHRPPTLQCNFCDKIFKVAATLRCHVSRIHMERKIICKICNKKYATKGDLTRHTKDSHANVKKS